MKQVYKVIADFGNMRLTHIFMITFTFAQPAADHLTSEMRKE